MKTKVLMSYLLLSTGCATTGIGVGELELHGLPTEPVAFEWTERTPDGGRLSAIAQDGELFGGKFVQSTLTEGHPRMSRAEMLPLQTMAWSGYDNEALSDFVKIYSGRVVARLQGNRGHELRCQFTLNDPNDGMNSGAKGQCRRSDGEVLSARFPAHRS